MAANGTAQPGDLQRTQHEKKHQERDARDIHWNPAAGAIDSDALEGMDAVVHLAGFASVAQSAGSGEQAWAGNFGAAFNIAGAVARHAPGATFLFVSSSEVYGSAFNRGPVALLSTSPERDDTILMKDPFED